jgi:hypothetical protein
MQCNAMQCNAMQCNAMQGNAGKVFRVLFCHCNLENFVFFHNFTPRMIALSTTFHRSVVEGVLLLWCLGEQSNSKITIMDLTNQPLSVTM